MPRDDDGAGTCDICELPFSGTWDGDECPVCGKDVCNDCAVVQEDGSILCVECVKGD